MDTTQLFMMANGLLFSLLVGVFSFIANRLVKSIDRLADTARVQGLEIVAVKTRLDLMKGA